MRADIARRDIDRINRELRARAKRYKRRTEQALAAGKPGKAALFANLEASCRKLLESSALPVVQKPERFQALGDCYRQCPTGSA